MTTATSPKRRRVSPTRAERKPQKPKLQVVDRAAQRRSARRRAFSLVSIAGLVATLFAVALLYAQLVEGQQQIDQLRVDITRAEADRAQLERRVAVASTPDAIVERAIRMGMVRAVEPKYLVAVRSADAPDAGS